MNADLSLISSWGRNNDLKFGLKKCKVMWFQKKRDKQNFPEIRMEGEVLEHMHEFEHWSRERRLCGITDCDAYVILHGNNIADKVCSSHSKTKVRYVYSMVDNWIKELCFREDKSLRAGS